MNTNEEKWEVGQVVTVKPEWQNEGEQGVKFVVLEDRGPRVAIAKLSDHLDKQAGRLFLCPWESANKSMLERVQA